MVVNTVLQNQRANTFVFSKANWDLDGENHVKSNRHFCAKSTFYADKFFLLPHIFKNFLFYSFFVYKRIAFSKNMLYNVEVKIKFSEENHEQVFQNL